MDTATVQSPCLLWSAIFIIQIVIVRNGMENERPGFGKSSSCNSNTVTMYISMCVSFGISLPCNSVYNSGMLLLHIVPQVILTNPRVNLRVSVSCTIAVALLMRCYFSADPWCYHCCLVTVGVVALLHIIIDCHGPDRMLVVNPSHHLSVILSCPIISHYTHDVNIWRHRDLFQRCAATYNLASMTVPVLPPGGYSMVHSPHRRLSDVLKRKKPPKRTGGRKSSRGEETGLEFFSAKGDASGSTRSAPTTRGKLVAGTF